MTGAELGRPTQAVIVAGGRGTRMRALTADRPKPMIEVGGRPFIEWLLESVRDRGFRRVLLLLGYRGDQVRDHVGDGRRWGVEVDHVLTDPDDETGRRFRAARALIDETFLFLYCDNIWPMPFERMWHRFARSDAAAMVTVYRNEDGYTRDNVRLDGADRVVTYDRTRQQPGLGGVEIGYAILRRDALDLIGDRNEPLQQIVYPELIDRRKLLAFATDHRYYSIGRPERLAETERFLTGPRTIILDRDGVLNERQPRATWVTSPSEFRWLPGALTAVRDLTAAGYRVLVVSNQAGIARGAMTVEDLMSIHRQMLADVEAAGGRIDGIYFCPHDWDAGCPCRKPRPGMLLQAQREHALDLTRTPFVGDDERDGQAAAAAGCPFIAVTDERPLSAVVRDLLTEAVGAAE